MLDLTPRGREKATREIQATALVAVAFSLVWKGSGMWLSDTIAIIHQGGFTMVLLLACSIATIVVACERWYVFAQFGHQLALARARNGDVARWFSDTVTLPLPSQPAEAERTHQANVLRATALLQARLPLLATTGALAPFIGLFGTVIGVMRAFQSLAAQRSAGIDVVGAGIAEALICTAAGLAVAIVAVFFYNLLRARMHRLLDALELIYLERSEVGEAATE